MSKESKIIVILLNNVRVDVEADHFSSPSKKWPYLTLKKDGELVASFHEDRIMGWMKGEHAKFPPLNFNQPQFQSAAIV